MKALALAACALTLVVPTMEAQRRPFTPPPTESRPVVETLHGVTLTDPYQWLENKNDPEVRAWSEAQHATTLDYLRGYPEIAGLRDEIAAYVDRDVVSAPTLRGEYQFLTKRRRGERQSKLYVREGEVERLLFDPEQLDPSGLTAISGLSYTYDGLRAAVGTQVAGEEISTYRIFDVATGQQIGEPIEGLRGFTFMRDGAGAYITVGTREMIERQQPMRTYRHRFGTPRSEDVFLIAPADAGNFASVFDATHEPVTFTSYGDFYATHSLKLQREGGAEVEIYSNRTWRSSPVEVIDGHLYILSNHEAPRFRIYRASLDAPTFDQWQEIVPEGQGVIQGFVVTGSHLIVAEKEGVQGKLRLYTRDGAFVRDLALPEDGNVTGVQYHRGSNTVFASLATFGSPTRIFKANADNLNAWELYYTQEAGINTSDIVGEVQYYTSRDGTRVPIILMYKRGTVRDGTNPTLLYGYGGFNIGMSVGFAGLNAAFINRGGVYAIAAIRGGDEYGEDWHQAGMLNRKQNVYDDFIAAAEYLISEGWTTSQRLAIRGGSNGGLLVGAVLVQRPDLFRAAISAVPLLDMVRYHRFLIARYWIPEYGTSEREADFRWLLAGSPYHNVRAGINLPPTLITAGENDIRVDPLHAKKMAAILQNNPGQVDPILLYVDFESGHGTGKSTAQTIDEQYLQWSFIMGELGMGD